MDLDLFVDTSRKGVYMALLEANAQKPMYTEIIDDLARGERASFMLDDLLKKSNANLSQVKRIMVTLGPGSFSGLRTGVAFCEGLCFSKRRSLYGVSTLLALSYFAKDDKAAVIIRARNDYWYYYEKSSNKNFEQNSEMFLSTKDTVKRLTELHPTQLVADDNAIANKAISDLILQLNINVINEKSEPLYMWEPLFNKVEPSLIQEAHYIQPSYFEKLH